MVVARSPRSPALAALLAALLVAPLVAPALLPSAHALQRHRRQLADDDALQPLEDASDAAGEQAREKRKLEGVTQAKFGIKNAVLGFVFGTRTGTTSPGRTLPSAGRTPTSVSSLRRKELASSTSSLERSSSDRRARQAVAADDIPNFDRNKVSLDFPGNLFGPSVSLLIRTTKVIGDVIQNSAVRYQSFLRLFRPLFKGQFEIKGLDPPTTTTSTTTPRPAPTTTSATAGSAEDNEVRRRRHL